MSLPAHRTAGPSLPASRVRPAPAATETALATLRRGVGFLAASAAARWLDDPWPTGAAGAARARLLSNWLRELDAFLHGVLDAAQPTGLAPAEDPRWSAVHRLGRVAGNGAGVRVQQGRLLALQRSRYTFWHYDGVIRRPDRPGGRWLTSGWSGAGSTRLRRFAIGDRLQFDGAALRDVCGFYERLGTGIAAPGAEPVRSRRISPAGDAFRRSRPYLPPIAATSVVGGSD